MPAVWSKTKAPPPSEEKGSKWSWWIAIFSVCSTIGEDALGDVCLAGGQGNRAQHQRQSGNNASPYPSRIQTRVSTQNPSNSAYFLVSFVRAKVGTCRRNFFFYVFCCRRNVCRLGNFHIKEPEPASPWIPQHGTCGLIFYVNNLSSESFIRRPSKVRMRNNRNVEGPYFAAPIPKMVWRDVNFERGLLLGHSTLSFFLSFSPSSSLKKKQSS